MPERAVSVLRTYKLPISKQPDPSQRAYGQWRLAFGPPYPTRSTLPARIGPPPHSTNSEKPQPQGSSLGESSLSLVCPNHLSMDARTTSPLAPSVPSDAAQAPASFDDLPREVQLRILADIPDLRSLYNLIRASPAASRLFTHVGAEVLEPILARSVAPQLHQLTRMVGALRTATSGAPLAASLEAFLDRFIRRGGRDSANYGPPAPRLTESYGRRPAVGDSLADIRGVLLLARRIACLAQSCTELYRERCKALSPAHLRKPPTFAKFETFWNREYDEQPYTPRDMGPTTWIEEQRAMCGFWRVQLLCELKRAAADDRTGWSAEENQQILGMIPEDQFADWRLTREEYLTVVDFLRGRPVDAAGPPGTAEPLLSLPSPRRGSAWPVSSEAPPNEAPYTWAAMLSGPARGSTFWVALHTFLASPIRGVDFWPYRRLGFALWDQEKLITLELCFSKSSPARAPGSPSRITNQFFAWRSILPKPCLNEVNRRSQKDWEAGLTRWCHCVSDCPVHTNQA